VKRGITVEALIAFTNRGGEKNLRKLEMRFLDRGVKVARTADDLVRYHGKMMIVDNTELFIFGFNYTRLDIKASRSFGISTGDRELLGEALNLFEADCSRKPYKPGSERFLVSPLNARRELAQFLKAAKKELLIYDVKITDREMIRLLEERAREGVEVRVIGKFPRHSSQIAVRKTKIRLHARVIVRDRKHAFLGSQSMRELELDSRREIGAIFSDEKALKRLIEVFEDDWKTGAVAEEAEAEASVKPPATKVAKRVAKRFTEDLPPVAPAIEQALKEIFPNGAAPDIVPDEIEESVQTAVKQVVREMVRESVEDAVEQHQDSEP
jgi:phosphatidylserine/phosphatidylglycerophosphate/cardiolipin synthase-like enzyme